MTGLVAGAVPARVGPVSTVRWERGRVEVVVGVVVDEDEVRRRRQRRAAPVLSLDLLNLLLRMPLSSPVGPGEVSDYDWRLLQAGSRIGAVDLAERDGVFCAVRRAVPPLQVGHVAVRAAGWRNGLRVASRFAPYGSRELLVDRLPVDELELRLAADYLGVGVSIHSGDPDQPAGRVVEPAPFRPARYTGASWLFAERLFAGRPPLGR